MRALYKAGFKLYIRYTDGIVELGNTIRAAKSMFKCNKRNHFKNVDAIYYAKGV